MLALVVVLAFLMVSTFRYRSFKGVDLRRRRSYISVLGIALLFLLVASQPEASLLAVTSLYTVSGPARLGRLLRLRRRREPPPPAGGRAAARAVSPRRPSSGSAASWCGTGACCSSGGARSRCYGRWVVPGGTVELGETLEEALVREMEEETGLRVEPVEVLTVFDRIERDGGRVATTT